MSESETTEYRIGIETTDGIVDQYVFGDGFHWISHGEHGQRLDVQRDGDIVFSALDHKVAFVREVDE